MAGRVILFGELKDRYETERLLHERFPEAHVETVGRSWDLVERACTGAFDVAVILKGPMWEHQQRLEAIGGLRRNSFSGRILHAGSFLTEKQDALAAGADFSFDPEQQRTEEVAWRALYRPRLAADHPYLRFLFVGEWAAVEGYGEKLPSPAPDVLMATTSCHEQEEFYGELSRYCDANPALHCVLVEDDGGDDVKVAALSCGVRPLVILAEEGLTKVAGLGCGFLRESWLARVSAP